MEPTTLLIGAAGIALFLWIKNRNTGAVLPPPEETPPAPTAPPNGVYPGVTMTLAQAQTRVKCAGFDIGASGADGIYGPKTRAALIAYQQANSLTAHGYLDQATADLLGSEVCPVTGEDLTSIGRERGYATGWSSRGLDLDVTALCVNLGALEADGRCKESFVDAYSEGFNKGAYDRGYQEAYQAALSGAPKEAAGIYGVMFNRGVNDGYAKGLADAGGGSTTGVALSSITVAGVRFGVDRGRTDLIHARAAGRAASTATVG